MFDFSVKNKLYSLLMRKADRVIQRNLKEVTLSAISRDSVWFYSQMKSGTTYTIIFLINYLNLVSKKGFTSKDVYEILPYFHSINAAIDRTSVSKIREEQRRLIEGVTNKYFLHTHDQIIDFSEKRVLLNRNPLDYLVSSYYFWYVNRGKKDSIEDVYKRILDRYIINYNNHERILKEQPNTTLSIMYEELIRKPELIFTQLVNFLGYEYDSGLLTEAVELSQKKKIKEMEEEGGKAVVASEGFKAKSFLRSGKIGDWENHLTKEIKEVALAYLSNNGVDIHSFTYSVE